MSSGFRPAQSASNGLPGSTQGVNLRAAGMVTGLWVSALIPFVLMLAACSDDASIAEPDVDTAMVSSQAVDGPTIELLNGDKLPLLATMQHDAQLIDTLPNLVARVVLADSGMQIAYTRLGQELAAEPLFIESQWLSMQSCTGQSNQAPLVIVIDDSVEPLTAEDDVVFDLRGIPAASATAGSPPIVQIGFADFAGAEKPRGAYLRSIMARHLWLQAALPERDFPYTCL